MWRSIDPPSASALFDTYFNLTLNYCKTERYIFFSLSFRTRTPSGSAPTSSRCI